jgi:hypothetical protein
MYGKGFLLKYDHLPLKIRPPTSIYMRESRHIEYPSIQLIKNTSTTPFTLSLIVPSTTASRSSLLPHGSWSNDIEALDQLFRLWYPITVARPQRVRPGCVGLGFQKTSLPCLAYRVLDDAPSVMCLGYHAHRWRYLLDFYYLGKLSMDYMIIESKQG